MRRHPIFARFYEWVAGVIDGAGGLEHRVEVAGEATGRVLEVGAGPGLNFRHYGSADSLVAVDPEPAMVRFASRRAAVAPVRVRLVRAAAEALPFPADSFDTVVITLALCSVEDPAASIGEVSRVLRPGGEVRFMEHVRSRSPGAARAQDVVTPVWSVFAGGCRPNRDPAAAFREAGFDVEVRSFPFGPPSPARPHVLGVARPGGSG